MLNASTDGVTHPRLETWKQIALFCYMELNELILKEVYDYIDILEHLYNIYSSMIRYCSFHMDYIFFTNH
jgi:hypothetical protein